MPALGEGRLWRQVGQVEGPYAEEPCARLVLHIHREVVHHLAEVARFRDLYGRTVR